MDTVNVIEFVSIGVLFIVVPILFFAFWAIVVLTIFQRFVKIFGKRTKDDPTSPEPRQL